MSSQFEGLFDAVKNPKPKPKIQKPKKGSSKILSPTPPLSAKKSTDPPAAKSVNPDFEQTLIYLKKDTKKEIKKLLLDDTSGTDFSDLVEQLLSDYLRR